MAKVRLFRSRRSGKVVMVILRHHNALRVEFVVSRDICWYDIEKFNRIFEPMDIR